MTDALPPGQFEIDELPRFGLAKFAERFPDETEASAITIRGENGSSLVTSEELRQLKETEQKSDFHCVTTWSRRGIAWGGYRFSDFYHQIVIRKINIEPNANFVIFRSQDGFRASLPLRDLLGGDVLLATKLDGAPLPVANGAPLRLIAPSHYGYKNAKHVSAIEFWDDERHYRAPAYRFMDHPRARVKYEERGRFVPPKLLRWIYRPLIAYTRGIFARALRDYESLHD